MRNNLTHQLIKKLQTFLEDYEVVDEDLDKGRNIFLQNSSGATVRGRYPFNSHFTTGEMHGCWFVIDKNNHIIHYFKDQYYDLRFINDYLLMAKKVFYDEFGHWYTKATVINYFEEILLPYQKVDLIVLQYGLFKSFYYYDEYRKSGVERKYKEQHLAKNGRVLRCEDNFVCEEEEVLKRYPPYMNFIAADEELIISDIIEKTVLFDCSGNPVFPPNVFDECAWVEGYYIVRSSMKYNSIFIDDSYDSYFGKYGLLDKRGKIVLPYIFDNIEINKGEVSATYGQIVINLEKDNINIEAALSKIG